jgi:hypothetical protein
MTAESKHVWRAVYAAMVAAGKSPSDAAVGASAAVVAVIKMAVASLTDTATVVVNDDAAEALGIESGDQ